MTRSPGRIGEEALGVAAGAQGGVHQHGARAFGVVTGERRGQQLDAAVEQDGMWPCEPAS
jgi:hypothetical protein